MKTARLDSLDMEGVTSSNLVASTTQNPKQNIKIQRQSTEQFTLFILPCFAGFYAHFPTLIGTNSGQTMSKQSGDCECVLFPLSQKSTGVQGVTRNVFSVC